MNTYSPDQHADLLNDDQAQPHSDFQQAQSDFSTTPLVHPPVGEATLPADYHNHTTITIQNELKRDDLTNSKEEKVANSTE